MDIGWVSATSRVEGDMKNKCSQVQELECRLPSVQHSDRVMLVVRWLGSTSTRVGYWRGPGIIAKLDDFVTRLAWAGAHKVLSPLNQDASGAG